MSQLSPSLPTPARPAAPSPAPAAGGGLDPVRILKRYKWLLIASAIIGAALGIGAHFLLARESPTWKPVVLFNVLPPPATDAALGFAQMSTDEMSRFMQTQIRVMGSDTVLRQVAEDPQLRSRAATWAAAHVQPDGSFNTVEALEQLRKQVNARAVPQTSLIELSFSSRFRTDGTTIVGLVREKYLALIRDQGRAMMNDRTRALRDTIQRLDNEIGALSVRRESIIREQGVESLDSRMEADRARQGGIDEQLQELGLSLQDLENERRDMIAQLENPAGVVFSDRLRAEADRAPVVVQTISEIGRVETQLQALLTQGFGREHREYKRLEAQLVGMRQNLDARRAEELRQIFDGRLDQIGLTIQGLQTQVQTLNEQRADISRRLIDLTRIQAELDDIDRRVQAAILSRGQANQSLNQIIASADLATANRVVVAQPEALPNRMSFPDLRIMLPAGLVLTVGLVGGLVILREVLDQRIKAPSDINLIPRARLLGWIPDASEEPEGGGAVETAFRDRPKGAIAESFRQLRAAVAKRTLAADHRCVLVVATRPDSGATAVVTNLALATAASDRKVLVIDANLRRPAIHRVFAVQEGPGLADVLMRQRTLADAVQKTADPNIDVLSVGSREARVVERLGATVTADLLAQARQAYDMVLIDVAPAVVAGDAQALAQKVDATVLVVRALAEKRGLVARIRGELAEAKGEFLGVLVNGVRSSAGGYMRGNIRQSVAYNKESDEG